MKYVIYLRVSTDQQDVDAQRTACLNYIARQGGGEHIEFVDQDVSGSLGMQDRDEMLNAIDSLKNGDVFLVDVRDRLGRSVYLNIVTSKEIAKKGATLACASQDMSMLDSGTLKLMETVLDAFAEFELYQIGRRTRNKLRELKNNGFRTGRIPYGYELGEAIQHTVITNKGKEERVSYKLKKNPTEQQVLYKMQEMAAKLVPLREISARLSRDGITGRSGKPFSHVSIHKILSNAPRHRQTSAESVDIRQCI